MVQNAQPPEQGSFPLTLDGSAPEELLKAGKYDWIADYSRQIVHSKVSAATEGDIEIVLLGSLPERVEKISRPPVIDLTSVFTQYDPPEIEDALAWSTRSSVRSCFTDGREHALQFGAQYPDEQRKTAIIFPHEATDESRARGLSYVPFASMLAETWWWWPRVAVRRRGGTRT